MSLSGVCKTTSGKRAQAAYTIVELMVSMAVGALVCIGIISFGFYSSRSVAALANYADMEQQNQLTLDKLTQQIRQVQQLTSYATSNGAIISLTFKDYDDAVLTFGYDPGNRTLIRTKGGVSQTLLTDCQSLNFAIFQRNVQPGTFDAVTTAVATNCKLVEVSWLCSKSVVGQPNTEAVQSTKITIRQ